jgi:hypothetical protein
MTKLFVAAAALVAALAQPAAAITFPALTTIYVGAGVTDFNGASKTATVFTCSNVSGQTANIRILVLRTDGTIASTYTEEVLHGRNTTVATSNIQLFAAFSIATGNVLQGTVNIESTQSGVFCSAMLIDRLSFETTGITLRLVRINGHPGAEE